MLNILGKWESKGILLNPILESSPLINDKYSLNLQSYGYTSKLEDRRISEFIKRDYLFFWLRKTRQNLKNSAMIVLDKMIELGTDSPSEIAELLPMMSNGAVRTQMSIIRKEAKSLRYKEINKW
ncbi:MAG: hypothetical protein P9X24_09625 [Candidatus Hatepunaea meridiana]|nr:hypothetical protein [Candidatus Hatepunaea meridiana]